MAKLVNVRGDPVAEGEEVELDVDALQSRPTEDSEEAPPAPGFAITAAMAFEAASKVASTAFKIVGYFLDNTGKKVNLTFEIRNFTKFPIKMDHTVVVGGSIHPAPLNIEQAETMKFSSANSTWRGSQAGVIFHIENRIFYLYWMVPLTFLGGPANQLAVGLTKKGVTKFTVHEIHRPDKMKANFASWDWKEYGHLLKYSQVEDDTFAMRAMMGNGQHSLIVVEIVPKDKDNFAEKFKPIIK